MALKDLKTAVLYKAGRFTKKEFVQYRGEKHINVSSAWLYYDKDINKYVVYVEHEYREVNRTTTKKLKDAKLKFNETVKAFEHGIENKYI